MTTVYECSAQRIGGEQMPLSAFEGKVLLIVNTASRCGLTPQYAGLEQLAREYREQGLEVLGFPCNQFKEQEPGTHEEIAEFCRTNYEVSFPLFAKLEVNGENAHPLYQHLKKETGGGDITWNFEKFLIGRDGQVVKRYDPRTQPEELKGDIEALL